MYFFYWKWHHRKWRRRTRPRKWRHNRKWRYFPRDFSNYSSSAKCWYTPHPAKGTFCTTTIVRKSSENDVTFRYDVISGDVTSDVISVEVTSGRKKKILWRKWKYFEKLWENDTRKITSCTRKTSNVAFQTLRFEQVQKKRNCLWRHIREKQLTLQLIFGLQSFNMFIYISLFWE